MSALTGNGLTIELERILRQVLADDGVETGVITDETDLLKEIDLDSISMISFLLAVEAELECVIDYETLELEDVATLRALGEHLQAGVAL